MNNGCICCTLNDHFFSILRKLSAIPSAWDELIIKATGIADPAGIALPLLSNPAVERNFKLERVIGLVDATLIESQLQQSEEAFKQIAFSDILLFNKCDQVSTTYLSHLQQRLAEINPTAKLLQGSKGHYPLPAITAFLREQSEEGWSRHIDAINAHDVHHQGDPSHPEHGHQHSDIHALSFVFDDPFDTQALNHRLYLFLLFQSKVIAQSVGKSPVVSLGTVWKSEEVKKS